MATVLRLPWSKSTSLTPAMRSVYHFFWLDSKLISIWRMLSAFWEKLKCVGKLRSYHRFNLFVFQNPIKTMKRYAPLSLSIVFMLYMFANIAYFAASEPLLVKISSLTNFLSFQFPKKVSEPQANWQRVFSSWPFSGRVGLSPLSVLSSLSALLEIYFRSSLLPLESLENVAGLLSLSRMCIHTVLLPL